MADIKRVWAEIRRIEATLPEFTWLVAATDPDLAAGGTPVIVQVAAASAAQLLHAKSHRLATEEELLAHQGVEERKKRQAFVEEKRREGIAIVPILPKRPTHRRGE